MTTASGRDGFRDPEDWFADVQPEEGGFVAGSLGPDRRAFGRSAAAQVSWYPATTLGLTEINADLTAFDYCMGQGRFTALTEPETVKENDVNAIRSKHLKLVTACCAVALMLSGTAIQADDDDRKGYEESYGYHMGYGWGRGMGRGMMMRFRTIDQNADGVISDDEAAANAEAVFTAMDADFDAEITEAEFMAVRMGYGRGRNKARQAVMQKRKKERFPLMDTDKNGTVSKAEFLNAAQKRFAAADTDQDGQVTPWEFRATRRIF